MILDISDSAYKNILNDEQYVIDKTADDAGARFKLYPRAIKYVEKQYTERIAATLKKKGYEDDIDSVVTYCIERTKVFNK